MKTLLLLGTLLLAGCATSITSTLNTAQRECMQVQAIITNTDGQEGVRIKCTWEEETFE